MTPPASSNRIRYDDIRKELPMRSLKRAFTRGNGGKLAFVWVLGAGALLTFLANPLLAGVFTAACAVLAVPITREELRNEPARRELIDQVIAERLAAHTVQDPELAQEIGRTRRTLTEMASRIARAEDRGRTDTPLEKVFADATELAFLQRESAEQAADLDRIVDFVVSNDASRGASTDRTAGPEDLRTKNLKAVLEEAKAARQMVATIGEQLDTMLLQGFQIERDTVDVVRAENAAQESHDAVERLQDVVDARRRAAARLGELFTPEGETSARA
jgi:hypothetical protein